MKYLRAFVVLALVAMPALVALGTPAQAALIPVPRSLPVVSTLTGAAFESGVMVEINKARTQHGLRPVRFIDTCVDRIANQWGRHLAETGAFEHRDQHQVLRRCHQQWAGEALIRGTGLTPQTIVQAWLDSPSHRAILLKRRASRAGMAIVVDGQGRQIGVLNAVDKR